MKIFEQLVRHEKLVAAATLLLVVALVVQIRYVRNEPAAPQKRSPGRPAVAATTKPAGHSPDTQSIEGTWEMTVPQKSRTSIWTLTLEQEGEALKGVIKSEGGDLQVTGTIDGRAVNLSAKRFGVAVEFPAQVEGETMTGEMRVLHIHRRWTARKL